jgi:hypothetical protein
VRKDPARVGPPSVCLCHRKTWHVVHDEICINHAHAPNRARSLNVEPFTHTARSTDCLDSFPSQRPGLERLNPPEAC